MDFLKKDYAKELFFSSLKDYKMLSEEKRAQAISELKIKVDEHLKYSIENEYTIASKWFIRLESFINNQLNKIAL